MDEIRKAFTLSSAQLESVVKDMREEMVLGLGDQAEQSTLKMIMTYVEKLPHGKETGSFLALDLGGSNFRVLRLTLDGKGGSSAAVRTFELTVNHMTNNAETLFGFIADCVKDFAPETSASSFPVPLGFTFSFPVRQTGLSAGILMQWTKGFSATGCEGQDVGALLQAALISRGLNVQVTAIVNDTVGTLMARALNDQDCLIGVIFGTGTNACYYESREQIKKWKGPPLDRGMVINMEWGGFGDHKVSLDGGPSMLPWTSWDDTVDKLSIHPGKQLFEKMISGKYQGEIVRVLCADLAKRGLLFGGQLSSGFATRYGFETKNLSIIEADETADLKTTEKLLEETLATPTSPEDRAIVKELCGLVSHRAARLSAAACVAVVLHVGGRALDKVTIAVDGTVFKKHPLFRQHLEATVEELRGGRYGAIKFAPSEDGSGQGAALVVAAACAGMPVHSS